MRTVLWITLAPMLAAVAAGLQAQAGQLVAGQLQSEPQVTVDLAEVGLAGNISATRLTLAPGIMTSDHTHTGRTSIFVMVQGVLTDVRGSSKREYKAGDVVTVAEGVTHHAENHGTVPVVYVELNARASK
jgi:quercetin dioxygenase-like cupin family protein